MVLGDWPTPLLTKDRWVMQSRSGPTLLRDRVGGDDQTKPAIHGDYGQVGPWWARRNLRSVPGRESS